MEKRYRELDYTPADGIFAAALLVIGFLFWNFVSVFRPGAGTVLFLVIICLTTGIYLKVKGHPQNRRSLICLGLLILFSAVFLLFDSYIEKPLNLALVMGLFIYWVALTTDNTIESRLSGYLVVELPHQVFVKGFANFPVLPAMLSSHVKARKGSKRIVAALAGVLIMIPIVYVIITLLIRADIAFESLMKKISGAVFQDYLIYVWYFILGIPVAFYLCSLIWGSSQNRPQTMTREQVDKAVEGARIIPAVTVYSALSVLNLVYAAFFVSQAAYLFSAFENILPGGMTYAEYARRGFFELCAVAAINLALMIPAHLLIKRHTGKVLMIETILLSVFTMLLTATGFSKMILYIQSYGLTRLRIYTSTFMVLLFVIFLIILLRQFIRFNSGRAMIAAVLIYFLGLCYGNVDGQIAKYNLKEYLAGELDLMEINSMLALSDGAVPYLYGAYENAKTEEDRQTLYSAITGDFINKQVAREPEKESFKGFNLQIYKAQQLRKAAKENPPQGWEELKRQSAEAQEALEKGFYALDANAAAGKGITLFEDGTYCLKFNYDELSKGYYFIENGNCVLYLASDDTKIKASEINGIRFRAGEKGQLAAVEAFKDYWKKGDVFVLETGTQN